VHVAKLVDAGTQARAAVIGRKFVKGAVMTRFYGSERYGITDQLADRKSRKSFVLTFEHAQQAVVAILAALDKTLHRPAKAMQLIQRIATLLAKEHKSLYWVSATGFPWQSCYHKPKTKRIRSWIDGQEVRTKITVGDLPEVKRVKSKNSSAPNFVQGLDAAHLQLVALWARDIKIPLVTIHDCFGCLAADAEQFRPMVHDQLSQMYLDHPNVLGEIRESAWRDLSPAGRAKLPALQNMET
jgi:DNA-directed RNA polymerase